MHTKSKQQEIFPNKSVVEQTEHKIELLKERIYATIALLAVLISIDTEHRTAIHAVVIVVGTAFSLWLASVVSTRMSRRIILGHNRESVEEAHYRLSKHAPLLEAAAFPTTVILLSVFKIIPLITSISISIGGLFVLMVLLSFLSARAVKFRLVATFIIALIELIIGVGIVWLKLYVSH